VQRPSDPPRFIREFLSHPTPSANYLKVLAAALEAIPPEQWNKKWRGKIPQAIGKTVVAEEDLEHVLVYLAPALDMRMVGLLEECARVAANEYALEDRNEHLMAYFRLAVKYAYEYNKPYEEQAPAIMRVLHALNLTQASMKDSEKLRIRQLRMLTIIEHAVYTQWPEPDLRNLWTWYQRTYFPTSQYPLLSPEELPKQ
jgi:hypothetical protein